MKICPACKHATDRDVQFCPVCGTVLAQAPETTQVPQAPVTPPPAYTSAVSYAPPAPTSYAMPQAPAWQQPTPPEPAPTEPVSKGKVITGMALAIAGMAMGISGALLSVLFGMLSGVASELQVAGIAGFVYGFIFLIFSLPLSIIGFVMSKKCVDAGSQSNMCRLGVKFGITGLILCGVMVIFSIIGLVSFVNFVDSGYNAYY